MVNEEEVGSVRGMFRVPDEEVVVSMGNRAKFVALRPMLHGEIATRWL